MVGIWLFLNPSFDPARDAGDLFYIITRRAVDADLSSLPVLKVCFPFSISPDQENLKRIDNDQKNVVENKRRFPNGDGARQQAGAGDYNEDKSHGG
jgi:hypothetical protein